MNGFSIVKLIEGTLNHIDPRLINHGKRVSYLVYRTLKRRGKHDAETIQKVVMLAMLHDIGAYKTEEIHRMVQFETINVWEHSVYGYLFIKYFSPLSALAPVVLFHHANCKEITHLAPSMRAFAQIIHIADRFDVILQTSSLKGESIKERFDKLRGKTLDPELTDLFFSDGWETLLDDLENDMEFKDILYEVELTEEDMLAFIHMVVLTIDFKSPQTVTHTISTACVCVMLSELFCIDENERLWMKTAALLHDLGKIGIPIEILEKPGRLTPEEMDVMKRHVVLTEEILSGNVDDCCIRLAARHHEKLNGSGYPRGVGENELSLGQRIVAVGDIISALYGVRSYKNSFTKEKIIVVLENMAVKGQLDADVVSAVVSNIDLLLCELDRATEPIINIYEKLQSENNTLLEQVSVFNVEIGSGLIC